MFLNLFPGFAGARSEPGVQRDGRPAGRPYGDPPQALRLTAFYLKRTFLRYRLYPLTDVSLAMPR